MSIIKTIKQAKRAEGLIITNKVKDWLESEGGTLGFGTPEADALMQRLMAASKANNSRGNRFGASSRGTCHRAQIFGFLGMPQSKWIDWQLQNIFNDGTFRHIRWQIMGMAAGVFTHVEYGYKLPDFRLGLSMDAINMDDEWVFELKGTSTNINTMINVENIPYYHVLQMHTYMFATGWDRAVYLAEAKMNQDWREIVVRRDEKIIREVRRELNELNEAVEDKLLPPVLSECKRHKGAFTKCPYAAMCLDHRDAGDHWPEPGVWETVEMKGRK